MGLSPGPLGPGDWTSLDEPEMVGLARSSVADTLLGLGGQLLYQIWIPAEITADLRGVLLKFIEKLHIELLVWLHGQDNPQLVQGLLVPVRLLGQASKQVADSRQL